MKKKRIFNFILILLFILKIKIYSVENITNLSSIALSDYKIELKWTPSESEDADSILIRYRVGGPYPEHPDSGKYWHKLPHPTSQTILQADKTNEKRKYYISFFVSDIKGNWSDSSKSSQDSITIPDIVKPSNVNILRIKQKGKKTIIEIRFSNSSPSPDADSVTLRYRLDDIYPKTYSDGNILTTFSNSFIKPRKPYNIKADKFSDGVYYISAFVRDKSNNWSDFNSEATGKCIFKRDKIRPKNIRALKSKALENKKIVLTWKPSTSKDAELIRICYDTLFPQYYYHKPNKDLSAEITTDTLIDLIEKTKYFLNIFVRDTSDNWSESDITVQDTVITLDETPPDNNISLSATPLSYNSIELTWNLKVIKATDAQSIKIWYSTSEFPTKAQMGNLVLIDSTLSNSTYNVNNLQEFTEYYYGIFLIDTSGNFSNPSDSGYAKATTFYIPRLFNTEGKEYPLTVSIEDTISGIIHIPYKLLDYDTPSNTIYGEYRLTNGASWLKLENCQGDIGLVDASDSSENRTIIWNAKKQLTNTFDRNSIQIRIISIDNNELSDTLRMDDTSISLDFKPPKKLKGLYASDIKPFEIQLSWDSITSNDAEHILFLYGKTPSASIEDTAQFPWVILPKSSTNYSVKNLLSNTQYYFSFFVGDAVPNWSTVTTLSIWSLNDRPLCKCIPIEKETSGDIRITYQLSDTELDILEIKTYYSLDGISWQKATITGDTNAITFPHYLNRTIDWHSKTDIPDSFFKSVWFKIVPFDSNEGIYDSIKLSIDNYHKQRINLLTPIKRQTGKIPFSYTVIDSTEDTIFLSCFFSIDNGLKWTGTKNVNLKSIGPTNYKGKIIWNSDLDVGENSFEKVKFKIIPSDGWENGLEDATSNFSIDNTPIIDFIKDPSVIKDTVEWVIRIIARNYDSISITKSLFFYNGLKDTITSLSTGNILYSDQYDSATIKWASKNDFTSNDSLVTIYLQFYAGNYIRELKSTPFSLFNNEKPLIKISEISDEQHGDVFIKTTLSDKDYDTLRVITEYFDSQNKEWHPATLEKDIIGIDSLYYKDYPLIWKSASDMPECVKQNVLIRMLPYDQDTGIADTVSILLTNHSVPVCESIIIPENDTLSDKFQIIHILKDYDQSPLDINLYYFLDSQWIKTENIYGKNQDISFDNYVDTIIWNSAIDFPDTSISSLRLKLIPNDNIIGQSAQSHKFFLDNTTITPPITGDFNDNGIVDLIDFSYAAQYWNRSARGITNTDSIKELAPSNGKPPFKIVMPDSVFDYQDLMVFTELCYWWFYNTEYDTKIDLSQKNKFLKHNKQKISINLSKDFSELIINLKIRDVVDLNFCRYQLFYNNNISFKDIIIKQKWDYDPEGSITSIIMKDSTKCDIGITRLSQKTYSFNGNTDIAAIKIFRKTNSSFPITIYYELFNHNHKIIESNCLNIDVPESIGTQSLNKQTPITVFPNPSYSNNKRPAFVLMDGIETIKQWVKINNSGFIFRIAIKEIDYENSFHFSMQIFDAHGNAIFKIPEQNIFSLINDLPPVSPIELYWNGCNSQGRKLAPGLYRAMFRCRTDRNSKTYYVNLGVK